MPASPICLRVRHAAAGAARAGTRRALRRRDGWSRRRRLGRPRARAQLLRRADDRAAVVDDPLAGARDDAARQPGPRGRATAMPTTYYHPASPIGQLISGAPPAMTKRTAVIGLGHGHDGGPQPAAASAGRSTRSTRRSRASPATRGTFTYLRDCARAHRHRARRCASVAPATPATGTYGLIVADAFSSDAIPTHLITREALALYFRKPDRERDARLPHLQPLPRPRAGARQPGPRGGARLPGRQSGRGPDPAGAGGQRVRLGRPLALARQPW